MNLICGFRISAKKTKNKNKAKQNKTMTKKVQSHCVKKIRNKNKASVVPLIPKTVPKIATIKAQKIFFFVL